MKRTPIIKVRNLEYNRSENPDPILSIKTLNVYENEAIAIVGKFGSGKSTLLRHLNGMITPQKGVVEIKGKNVKKNPKAHYYQIVGLLMEDADDQLIMSKVIDDITFGPKNLGLKPEVIKHRVIQATQFLGIESLLNRDISTLSNGEKKLVALAGVLAMGSEVLLLDNPTEGLDLWTKDYVIDKIFKLRENHSIVLTANDWEILELVDRIIYLESGEIIRTFYSIAKFKDYLKEITPELFKRNDD